MKALTTFAGCKALWELNFVLEKEGTGILVESLVKDTAVMTAFPDKMLCVEIDTQWKQTLC